MEKISIERTTRFESVGTVYYFSSVNGCKIINTSNSKTSMGFNVSSTHSCATYCCSQNAISIKKSTDLLGG